MSRNLISLGLLASLAGCNVLDLNNNDGPVNVDPANVGIEVLAPLEGDVTVFGDATDFIVLVDSFADGWTVMIGSDLDGDLCEDVPDMNGVARCSADLQAGDHIITVELLDGAGAVVSDVLFRHEVVQSGASIADLDGDGYTVAEGDCDDTNPNTYPGALELVDDQDNDCDGFVDEGIDTFDNDGDGYAEADGDCDDADPARNPGAPELADGIDNNCDGVIDEGTPGFDDDGDGYSESDGDCFDGDATIFPGAPEVADGLDNDCDGVIDEGTVNADDDGDGYAEINGDCNDLDPDIHPAAQELLDGLDNDCDGDVDEGTEVFDDDGDGFSEAAGDCNDALAQVYPGAVEVTDGLDNDCDGIVDERDGTYTGSVTVSVSGPTAGSCSGTLDILVDEATAVPIAGLGDCMAGLFENLQIDGIINGDEASGDVEATVVGNAATTTWTGGFSGDTLSGGFMGTATDGTDTWTFVGVFDVAR